MLIKRIINTTVILFLIWLYYKSYLFTIKPVTFLIEKDKTAIEEINEIIAFVYFVTITIIIVVSTIIIVIDTIHCYLKGDLDEWLEKNVEPHIKKLYAWFDRRNNHSG